MFSVMTTAFFFGVAEGLCRLKGTPRALDPGNLFEYDRQKVYRLKANYKGLFTLRYVGTNSNGYRDSEIPLNKDSRAIRILAVGDSVTFGFGVSEKETYPELCEQMLNREFPSHRFDFINTAVPGNSPFQEFFDAERGMMFRPDIVTIQFVLNDVIEPYKVYRRFGGLGIDYHGVEDISYLDWFLGRHSAFYRFLKDRFARLRFGAGTPEEVKRKAKEIEALDWNAAAYEPTDPKIKEAWAECLRQLQKIVELCRKNNAACVLIVSPVDFQLFQPDLRYAQSRLKAFASENRIACLDLLEPLEDQVRRRLAAKQLSDLQADGKKPARLSFYPDIKATWSDYFLDNDHYNPRGHQLIAENLYPVLVRILKENNRIE